MKLYVRKGKVEFRPTLKIRDTGYARNHWQELVNINGREASFCGSYTVRDKNATEAVELYLMFLKDHGYKPVWRDQ